MKQSRLPANILRGTGAAAIALSLSAGHAQANMGTPLMWAGFGHLVIGNALIGIIEGCLLVAVFRARVWRTIGTMVLGNYIAWWACGPLLPLIGQMTTAILGSNALLHLRAAVAAGLLLAFILSLVIEAPFSYFCACSRCVKPGAPRPSGARFLRAHIVAQAVTYALLVGWYGYASETSLLRVAVRQELLGRMPEGWVYFTELDGRPARVRLTGGPVERDCDWPVGMDRRMANVASSLDPSSPWVVHPGAYAADGITARHEDGRSIRVAMDTPVISWPSLHPTLVHGGNAVYELGDQIVVVDFQEKAIARLAAGRSPHVVLGY